MNRCLPVAYSVPQAIRPFTVDTHFLLRITHGCKCGDLGHPGRMCRCPPHAIPPLHADGAAVSGPLQAFGEPWRAAAPTLQEERRTHNLALVPEIPSREGRRLTGRRYRPILRCKGSKEGPASCAAGLAKRAHKGVSRPVLRVHPFRSASVVRCSRSR